MEKRKKAGYRYCAVWYHLLKKKKKATFCRDINVFILFCTSIEKGAQSFFDKWKLVKDGDCWPSRVYAWLFDILQNASFAFITKKEKSTIFGLCVYLPYVYMWRSQGLCHLHRPIMNQKHKEDTELEKKLEVKAQKSIKLILKLDFFFFFIA